MTSRLRQRIAGVAAVVVILIIALLIGVLWAGTRGGLFGPSLDNPPAEIRMPESRNVTTTMVEQVYREFVRPLKVSPQGLHEDDILYNGDQVKDEVPLRHHSGHYRTRTAHVWDPHPVYEFFAFQRLFVLILEHDTGFVPPALHVSHVYENTSYGFGGTRRNHHDCFYRGRVKGDEMSIVAVNLCHGMTGHIKTAFGSFLIRPTEQSADHSLPLLHVIYRETIGKTKCGLIDDVVPVKVTKEPDFNASVVRVRRSIERQLREKRSVSQEYFVELMIVADRTMAEYHGDFLENYILSLMYIVSGIFKDATIGNPITISLVKLEILYDRTFARHRNHRHGGVSATEMLSAFCAYQASPIYNGESSFHHDTALLLTRENICRDLSENNCETLGLAELGTVCEPQGSCSIVQDNGLSAAFTIAHELGHVLNMPHDGETYCRQYTNSHSYSHVMSNSHHEGTNPWSWSECSRHIVTEFLDSKHGACLKDRPRNDILERWAIADIQPGELVNADRQCELLYGHGSRICSYKPVCFELWCTQVDGDGCQTLHMPWGDGTPCAEGAWCQKGRCVPKNREALKKIDGQWGPWQEFGACSRSCGGGIKKSHRECNNPRPKNGGRYCVGSRVRYKSCETSECPPDSRDFRQIQCSKFDSNTRGIPGLPLNVKWVPKYGMSNDDRCNLYCRATNTNSYFSLRDKVIDGTPCSPDSFDVCVNGQCTPAGCDHILHSGIYLDVCGKCGGQNDTCKLVRGHYNQSARAEGYRSVVRIPAGSSNLDIRQHGNGRLQDDNYLALTHGLNGDGLLNNDYVLTTFRKLISFEGTTLEYSGSTTTIERINASRPLKRDLQVEVLSVGRFTAPDITYQYTVPKANEDRYIWRHVDEWSDCDSLCNGKRTRQISCFITDSDDVINESYCSLRSKPAPMVAPCNTNCDLMWRITGRSECSSHCGRGTRTVSKECVQVHKNQAARYTYDGKFCSHLANTPAEVEECDGPCDSAHWKYYDWAPCSTTCGTGVQTREAVCVDDLDRAKPSEKCAAQDKVDRKHCDLGKCPTFYYGNWSSCSVSCGKGVRTKEHFCQRNYQLVDMALCGRPNDIEQVCELMPCTRWSTTGWGPCSVSCGVGYATRNVTCVTDMGYPVTEGDCRHETKPRGTQECHTSCVYASHQTAQRMERDFSWAVHEWSACSHPCAGGNQTRRVYCPNRICQGEKPVSERPCNQHACPQWIVKDWSLCSSTCGNGVQQRQVLCQNSSGLFIQDAECERISLRPTSEKACQIASCPKLFRWRLAKWTPCSKSCGTGIKSRQIRCVDERTRENVDESYCSKMPQPRKRSRICVNRLCPFMWQEGVWSECSASCGVGTQSRNATCHQVNNYNWMDPDPLDDQSRCDSRSKPLTKQQCVLRDCSSNYYWAYERWTKCTKTCGNKGTQRPLLGCKDSLKRPVARSKCHGLTRPFRKRTPCNIRPCMFASCAEIQQQTHARTDAEYTIVVGGVNTTVYCKDMNTDSPTEYLTLNFPNENFVWFTHKLADNCPGDGAPDPTHENQSFTGFDKVRLDVNRLAIFTNDFSFTNRGRGTRSPFGELGKRGYCSTANNCLQGLFRINLSGTPFQISPLQQWRASPYTSFKLEKENPQKMWAKCGGFCGHCYPATSHVIKLYVLPP